MSQANLIIQLLSTPQTSSQLIEALIDYDLYPTDESLIVQLCQLQKAKRITSNRTRCPDCGKAITLYRRIT